MKKLQIQKIYEWKSNARGCFIIAQNFIELALRMLRKTDDLQNLDNLDFDFHDLPPNFAFCLDCAFDIYRRMSEAGIDLRNCNIHTYDTGITVKNLVNLDDLLK